MNDFPFMILLPTGGAGSDVFSRLSSLGNLYGGASTGSLASLGTQFGASQPGGGSSSLVQPTAPAAPQGTGIPNSTASDASKNFLGAGINQSSLSSPSSFGSVPDMMQLRRELLTRPTGVPALDAMRQKLFGGMQ
jgi:hypothetical protein